MSASSLHDFENTILLIFVMSNYYPKTLKQWRVQKLPSSDDLTIRPPIRRKETSFKSQVIHSFDQCSSKNNFTKHELQGRKIQTRQSFVEHAKEIKPKNFLIRQARHSSCENMPTGDRCIKKFERLIKAEQAVKISSNLNMIVRNFIMSCTTKRRDVKKIRKETIRMEQNKSVLAGVLHISTPRCMNKQRVHFIDEKQEKQEKEDCIQGKIEEEPIEQDSFSPYEGKKAVIDANQKLPVEETSDKDELRMSFITIKEMSIVERNKEERQARHLSSSLGSNSQCKFPSQIRRKIGSKSTILQPNHTVTIAPWDNSEKNY